MGDIDEDCVAFFKQCTDAQLKHNMRAEWNAYKHRNYVEARIAAEARGWIVEDGERIG